MPPKTTRWKLPPHTVGKHEVLRKYLDAWLPIVAHSPTNVMTFVDGFAGPGRYSDGEEGSPLIALKALDEHADKAVIAQKIKMMFVEADSDRYYELAANTEGYRNNLPQVAVTLRRGEFDDVANLLLDQAEKGEVELGPSFFMIDPCGAKGVRFETIKRILSYRSTEIYLTFMYSYFNEWKSQEAMARHVDGLYGTKEWRDLAEISDSTERKSELVRLFIDQLKSAGAKYVLNFDLFRHQNDFVYSIFFATQSPKGCDVMKEAMWKVDPSGGFSFRGGRLGQTHLGIRFDNTALRAELMDEFAGKGPVPIEAVEDFITSDKTLYRSGHLKNQTLTPMEQEGLIEVNRPRRTGFTPGTTIRFLEEQDRLANGQPSLLA